LKKGRSPLPKELGKYDEAAKASFENAVLWLEDAKLLIDKSSFGHAIALVQFALEEIVKAQTCWFVSESIWPLEDNKLLEEAFSSHPAKNQMIIGNVVGIYLHNYLVSIAKGKRTEIPETARRDMLEWTEDKDGQHLDQWPRRIEEDRQRSIYVDFDLEKKMTTPNQATKEGAMQMYDFAEAMFVYVRQFTEMDQLSKENLRRHFKSWPKEIWKTGRLTEERPS
jgi:AbiV family abortive infection protein